MFTQVPKQNDDKSCGFFVLFYATMFLKMCPPVFSVKEHYPSFVRPFWCLHMFLIWCYNVLDKIFNANLFQMTKNLFSNKRVEEFRRSVISIFSNICAVWLSRVKIHAFFWSKNFILFFDTWIFVFFKPCLNPHQPKTTPSRYLMHIHN